MATEAASRSSRSDAAGVRPMHERASHPARTVRRRAARGRWSRMRRARSARRELPAPVAVFAVGKAASAMALGAHDALGDAHRAHAGHHQGRPLRSRTRAARRRHDQLESRAPRAGRAQPGRRCRARARACANLREQCCRSFWSRAAARVWSKRCATASRSAELRALNERGLAAGWDIATLNAERAQAVAAQGRRHRAPARRTAARSRCSSPTFPATIPTSSARGC